MVAVMDNIRVPGLCGEVREHPGQSGVAPGNVGRCMTGFLVQRPLSKLVQ